MVVLVVVLVVDLSDVLIVDRTVDLVVGAAAVFVVESLDLAGCSQPEQF